MKTKFIDVFFYCLVYFNLNFVSLRFECLTFCYIFVFCLWIHHRRRNIFRIHSDTRLSLYLYTYIGITRFSMPFRSVHMRDWRNTHEFVVCRIYNTPFFIKIPSPSIHSNAHLNCIRIAFTSECLVIQIATK